MNASALTNFEETRRFLEQGPHSIEAEQYFLSAAIKDPSVLLEIRKSLSGNDFYDPVHTSIFFVLSHFAEKDELPETQKIAQLVQKRASLADLGGARYLESLRNLGSPKVPLRVFTEIIRTMANARSYLGAPSQDWSPPLSISTPHDDKMGEKVDFEQSEIENLASLGPNDWLAANLMSLSKEAKRLSEDVEMSSDYVQYICSGIR